MSFKLMKRRYRSGDENELLRNLTYFNQPFEPGNDIKLMDDVTLPRPLMVLGLGTDTPMDQELRGQKNMVERREVSEPQSNPKELTSAFDFDPFDENADPIQY